MRVEPHYLISEFKPNLELIQAVKDRLEYELSIRQTFDAEKLNNLIDDAKILTGNTYSIDEAFDYVSRLLGVNPLYEIQDIISRIAKVPCQNLIVLILYFKDVPLGIISVMFDDNLVYGKEYSDWGFPLISTYQKIGYFIGISKFVSWYFVQSRGWLKEYKLNSFFIPYIVELARTFKCVYVGCTPLTAQDKILRKHYGFVPSIGGIYSKTGKFISTLAIETREHHLVKKI